MSLSGKGKYIVSIITLLIFVSSEYTFLHQQKITTVEAAEASSNTPQSVSSTSTAEDSRPLPTSSLGTQTNQPPQTSVVSDTLPTATPTKTSIPSLTPTISPSAFPTVSLTSVSPTPTPDCTLHGNKDCGIVGQTTGKIKQVKQSTTNLIQPLGL